jgi:hypothetical protein
MLPFLFAESFHDWFNSRPYAPFVAIGLLGTFGLFLLYEGRRGITQGELRGAWGRVYTGKSARRNGIVFCILGSIMVAYAVIAAIGKAM